MKLGITGHQDLGSAQDVRWTTDNLRTAIQDAAPTEGFSCLAKGADQLFAQILVNRGIPVIAVIPCQGIETTFSAAKDLEVFRDLRRRAAREIALSFHRPSEQAFFDAGKAVVKECDVLLAVWNGEPAAGLGGTADVVRFAVENGRPVIHLNPVAKTVSRLPHSPG